MFEQGKIIPQGGGYTDFGPIYKDFCRKEISLMKIL